MPTGRSAGLEDQAEPSCAPELRVGQGGTGRALAVPQVPLLREQEPGEGQGHLSVPQGTLLPPPQGMHMEALASPALWVKSGHSLPLPGLLAGCHSGRTEVATQQGHRNPPVSILADPTAYPGSLPGLGPGSDWEHWFVWQGASCKAQGLIPVPQQGLPMGRHREQNLPEMMFQL